MCLWLISMTRREAPQCPGEKNAVTEGINRNVPLQLSGFAGLPSDNYPGTVSNKIFDVPVRRNFEFANAVSNPALNRPLGIARGLLLDQIDTGSRT
jgi:hypothetical protein